MDKIDELMEIENILGEWASLLGIDEREKMRELIKGVVMSLSHLDQRSLKDIADRFLLGKELKGLEERIKL